MGETRIHPSLQTDSQTRTGRQGTTSHPPNAVRSALAASLLLPPEQASDLWTQREVSARQFSVEPAVGADAVVPRLGVDYPFASGVEGSLALDLRGASPVEAVMTQPGAVLPPDVSVWNGPPLAELEPAFRFEPELLACAQAGGLTRQAMSALLDQRFEELRGDLDDESGRVLEAVRNCLQSFFENDELRRTWAEADRHAHSINVLIRQNEALWRDVCEKLSGLWSHRDLRESLRGVVFSPRVVDQIIHEGGEEVFALYVARDAGMLYAQDRALSELRGTQSQAGLVYCGHHEQQRKLGLGTLYQAATGRALGKYSWLRSQYQRLFDGWMRTRPELYDYARNLYEQVRATGALESGAAKLKVVDTYGSGKGVLVIAAAVEYFERQAGRHPQVEVLEVRRRFDSVSDFPSLIEYAVGGSTGSEFTKFARRQGLDRDLADVPKDALLLEYDAQPFELNSDGKQVSVAPHPVGALIFRLRQLLAAEAVVAYVEQQRTAPGASLQAP